MEWYWYLIILLVISMLWLIWAIKTAPLMPDDFEEVNEEDEK